MNATEPRTISLLGLLVLLPVAVYWTGVPGLGFAPALSVSCILLIVGSLWVMFSPTEDVAGTAH